MSEELEKVKKEVEQIGCFVFMILILLILLSFGSCSKNGIVDQLDKQNKILEQILYYTEKSK